MKQLNLAGIKILGTLLKILTLLSSYFRLEVYKSGVSVSTLGVCSLDSGCVLVLQDMQYAIYITTDSRIANVTDLQ